jgi:hypothetical protein
VNHTEIDVRSRIIKTILIALAVWGLLSFAVVFWVILIGSENTDERAVILEGGSLIFLWCIAGGLSFKCFKHPLITNMQRIAIPWGLRFVVFCILFAMLEEAVTTSLSNLAVHFLGASMKGIITASLNYWEVIGLHSVVVFVPMFIVWVFLLRRLDF